MKRLYPWLEERYVLEYTIEREGWRRFSCVTRPLERGLNRSEVRRVQSGQEYYLTNHIGS